MSEILGGKSTQISEGEKYKFRVSEGGSKREKKRRASLPFEARSFEGLNKKGLNGDFAKD